MIDTHAHLSSKELFKDAPMFIQNAVKAGVDRIVNICTDHDSLKRGLELEASFPMVVNTGAITPHDVDTIGHEFNAFEKAAREGLLVAIGETGLDYHYEHSCVSEQKSHLKKYFQLAKETALPVVIHCREAFADLFAIADEYYNLPSVVLHCFTGTVEEMQECVKRGWMVSFSGIVTFKKSLQLQEAARLIPLEHLFIETDSPYLAPVPMRGKTNEPAYIKHTYEFVAAEKKISRTQLEKSVKENANRFFSL